MFKLRMVTLESGLSVLLTLFKFIFLAYENEACEHEVSFESN